METTPKAPAPRLAVAAEILALMGRTRTSQKALAAVLGLSQPSLSKRLSGKQAFDLDELLKIAAHFDVVVTDLLVAVGRDVSELPWITMPGQLSLLAA